MVFYKLKGDLTFQLLNLEVREDFDVWDNVGKKFLRNVEGVANMNDLKFMKADLFAQRYPNLRKNTQYIRNIAVYELSLDGEETLQRDFGFKKTANDQIMQFVTNMSAVQQDPLAIKLQMRVTGTGIGKTYVVSALNIVGRVLQPILTQIPQHQGLHPSNPQTPLNQPVMSLETGQNEGVALTLTNPEKQVLDLFDNSNEYYAEDRFVEVFNHTMKEYFNSIVMPDRVRQIYSSFYKKR